MASADFGTSGALERSSYNPSGCGSVNVMMYAPYILPFAVLESARYQRDVFVIDFVDDTNGSSAGPKRRLSPFLLQGSSAVTLSL